MHLKIIKLLNKVRINKLVDNMTSTTIKVKLDCGHLTTINTTGLIPDYLDCNKCNKLSSNNIKISQ